MTYINKNANMLLLFLIVLVAGTLVGATLFFQARFTKVNAEYDAKLMELQNLTEQAENYKTILQKAQVELELKASREETFTEKYTDAKTTADQLQKTTAELQADVADLTEQIVAKSKQVSDLNKQVVQLTLDVETQKDKVEDLEDEVNDLDDEVDCLSSTPDASEGDC